MNRRQFIEQLSRGAALAGLLSAGRPALGAAENGTESKPPTGSSPPLKITKVKAILTAPARIRLGVVKVETSEPGLYGLGCATFTQRIRTVVTAVDQYLAPFLAGKDADNIEDLWQAMYQSSYWRNGPVLMNALSGVDTALWDIKAKRAGMPLYQLLGGKCRVGVPVYRHASGPTPESVADIARGYLADGYRYIRAQVAVPGNTAYGASSNAPSNAGATLPREGHFAGELFEPAAYRRTVPRLFRYLREHLGEEVELLHDVHERLPPIDAIGLAKELEPYHLFFLEDPFAPEDVGYFKHLRQQSATPIAMGELFNNPNEWLDLVSGDTSPVGHAAQWHLDMATWNFGIQECTFFDDATREVFPGTPEIRKGLMYGNEKPGLGIDIDETLAAKYPIRDDPPFDLQWGRLRGWDGTIRRP
jgi:mannonate dehydratase